MITPYFYSILDLHPPVTIEQVKEAYHRQAKKNHPDLFPETKKNSQQLKMMKINEAYMSLMKEFMISGAGADTDAGSRNAGHAKTGGERTPSGEPDAAEERSGEPHPEYSPVRAEDKKVAGLRDPAYSYYKRAFTFYQYGYMELFKKDPRIIRSQLAKLKTYDAYILKLTIAALRYFEQSYRYFMRVVEEYPDSIWINDSRAKLRKIEKYNSIYHKICSNLSRNLQQIKTERAS
jgi:hypothetical protein